jgi:hypothetical protein
MHSTTWVLLMRLRLVSTQIKVSVCNCNLCIFNTNSCTIWTNQMDIFWFVHHLMQQQMKLPRGLLFQAEVIFLTGTFCASMLPHITRKKCNLAISFLCSYCNFYRIFLGMIREVIAKTNVDRPYILNVPLQYINYNEIIHQSLLKCFIVFRIVYSYNIFWQTWPSSGNTQRTQNTWEDINNMKFYKKEWHLVFTYRILMYKISCYWYKFLKFVLFLLFWNFFFFNLIKVILCEVLYNFTSWNFTE